MICNFTCSCGMKQSLVYIFQGIDFMFLTNFSKWGCLKTCSSTWFGCILFFNTLSDMQKSLGCLNLTLRAWTYVWNLIITDFFYKHMKFCAYILCNYMNDTLCVLYAYIQSFIHFHPITYNWHLIGFKVFMIVLTPLGM